MVAWFIIAIGTVALFAYIAVAGITTVDTAGTAVTRAETIRRVDAVVATLSRRATTPVVGGGVMLPAGVPASGGYLLPTDMQQTGRTTGGVQFQYCPMGVDLTGQNRTVESSAGGAYGIRTVTLNGASYVAAGRPSTGAAADRNIAGFVIAPLVPGAVPAGCNQVQTSGDGYAAPNSIVRAVRLSTTTNEDLARGSDAGTWYVSTTGVGRGSSPSDAASLSSALESYRSSVGGRYVLRLAGGSYSLAGSPLDQTVSAITPKRTGSSLSIIGAGVGSTILSVGRISVPGDFEIRGVDARSSDVVMGEGRFLGIRSANVGGVTLTGGARMNVADGSSLFPSDTTDATIQVLGGSTAQIFGNVDVYYGTGKTLAVIDGTSIMNITSSAFNGRPVSNQAASTKSREGIVLKTGGSLSIKDSIVDFNMSNQSAVVIAGNFMSVNTTYNTNAQTDVALQTLPGAAINMANVTWRGARPATYGFAGQYASSFVGNGNVYSSGRCWYRGDGSIFRLSPVGVAGDPATVTPDEPAMPMDAQPTAQQAADYQASQARNVDRANLRSRMTVGETFTCQQSSAVVWNNCTNNPAGAANEGAYCTLPPAAGNVLVRYGSGGSYAYRWVSNGVACNNATFTDPLVGTLKTCQYAQ